MSWDDPHAALSPVVAVRFGCVSGDPVAVSRKGWEMADGPVEVLWALGEAPWRDLRTDIAAAGRVTAVTAHSVHLLDVDLGVAARVPGPWANYLCGDVTEWSLRSVTVATPCGLVLHLAEVGRRCSTPLVLLLGGWVGTDEIAGPLDALHRRHGPGPVTRPEHPGESCGALYCSNSRGGLLAAW
jgi:hypothetical protein